VDSNGHGTPVIGSILGDGTMSVSVTNAGGSIMPPATNQFRGQAPAATVFVLPIDMANRELVAGGAPRMSDAELQEVAASTVFLTNGPPTNALI
jgi:hypothetical protein